MFKVLFATQYHSFLFKFFQITHRDVAMRNVLISNNKVCKITDFERAKKGETTRKISIEKKIKEILKAHMSKDIPKEYPNECLKGVYYYYSVSFSRLFFQKYVCFSLRCIVLEDLCCACFHS